MLLENEDEELASGVLGQTQGCGVFGLVDGGLLLLSDRDDSGAGGSTAPVRADQLLQPPA